MVEELENGNNEPEEGDLGVQVDGLLEKGYTQREIVKQGFSGGLVRQRIRKRTKRLGKQAPESGNGNKGEVALTIKEKEQVLPEWLESQVGELYDGDEKTRKIFMAGMSIPLLGMRLFSESFKPLLALMQTYTAGQAEAAKAAAGGAEEIAKSTIVEALPYITNAMTEVAKANAPKEINPLGAMMARLIEPLMSNALSGVFKVMLPQGQQAQNKSSLPPGWTSSEEPK